ncbi:type II toxin-antitoxin system HipA family toxin [Paraglaciecola sp. MB-3u-78]|uniref:type II toxin-antitoxin system HipA family toxin n=1 Tax=Paraglaciecola sp. MB-3u-78 TaxID=2058332 RepID=UPI000C328C40|nr:HipA domain-containing protein [Paraglaciecola sp. MB-3u-78]PKG96751.1 toxin HipA [Paraglaciecola sp. MB-3u-78]
MSTQVLVFADWEALEGTTRLGTLRASIIRNRESFSFSYENDWLMSGIAQQIDPELQLYAGEQYTCNDSNFRVFLDSCPDRWGRVLMQRREAVLARDEKRRPIPLREIDYLLGVHDMYRMGALRFKKDSDGDFLDNNNELAAPPIASLKELEYAAQQIEQNIDLDNPEYRKWLNMLMSPGSSLGGARPKSCVVDENNELWLAKFPSGNDDYDVGAWEYVTHRLALDAGINMSPCQIHKFNSDHHTFLTKRFDRTATGRLHFSSAMTQLEYFDGEEGASYLELAEFLTVNGSNTQEDLAQLWRRIVFNIAVSNCDDHLRNHGFIYRDQGWVLSPAYDINPVNTATGLHLNISEYDNSLDFDLAMEVIGYFQLAEDKALQIKEEIIDSVKKWSQVASSIGISRQEQQLMTPAFNI